MKEYKGLYHNEKTVTPCYEYGAHFKYLDLVNALKELQSKITNKNENENLDLNFSPIKDETALIKEKIKKPKKYKLKTKILNTENKANNENKRYNNVIDNNNENEDISENIIIRRESNKDLFNSKRKRNKEKTFKGISKSIDRRDEKLPKININNSKSISLRNKSYNPHKLMEKILFDNDNDDDKNIINNEIKEIEEYNSKNKNYELENIQSEMRNRKLHKSKKNVRNYNNLDILPKINTFRNNQIEDQNTRINMGEIEETPSQFEDEKIIKIQNNINANRIISPIKKISHKGLNRLFLNDLITNTNENQENKKFKIFKNNRIKSIFETEKQIKNHNLLTDRIHNRNRNNLETINTDMAQEIYQLKKQLLNNQNK